MRLRMVFRPLVKLKVTIMLDASGSHRKALAITRTASFLDSVVELRIGEWARQLFQVQYIFSPALFTLVKALPAMRQLHTLQLFLIFLPETYLHCILSSPHLTHLILSGIQMPKISRFPPRSLYLRKLTLKLMVSLDAVRPLIVHLAASLECLEFDMCVSGFGSRSQPQLPYLPSLRELRYQHYSDMAVLDELTHVSQITHLHLSGTLVSSHITIAAFPKSLQHLSTPDGMLTQRVLGTTPLTQLVSLSIQCSQKSDLLKTSSFVCDHFPRITSLHLDIPWSLRNIALVMARSQHNVRAIELSIVTEQGLDSGGKWPWNQVEILNDHLRNNMSSGALQSLRLDVVQYRGELEPSLAHCSRWIDDDILHPVTGLGGSDLKSIDVSFVQAEGGSERERRIWKRWAKLPDGGWRMEGAVCGNKDTNVATKAALVTSLNTVADKKVRKTGGRRNTVESTSSVSVLVQELGGRREWE